MGSASWPQWESQSQNQYGSAHLIESANEEKGSLYKAPESACGRSGMAEIHQSMRGCIVVQMLEFGLLYETQKKKETWAE